jgi:hypothetical protein
MRLAAILSLAALPLAACGQGGDEPATETPVVENEVAPASSPDDAQIAPGEASPGDPAPDTVNAPSSEANPPTPSPDEVGEAEQVGEQYQDFVGETAETN